MVYSQTWNPDPRTLHPGLFCLLTTPRKCQVVLGNIAPLFSEGRLRQSPWLCCGQAETKPTPSDPECTLSPPQGNVAHCSQRLFTLMLRSGEAFSGLEHLPLDPEPSLSSDGRARPFLPTRDGPLAVWRQGFCVAHSPVSSRPIFNASQFCLFT